MEYSPLPPIIPISACGNHPPERLRAAQVKLVIIQDGESAIRDAWIAGFLRGARGRGADESGASCHNSKHAGFLHRGLCAVLFAARFASAQRRKSRRAPSPKSVTVPAAIDHNRVVIDADVRLPDGSTQRVHAWVDNGNPDLYLSRRLATLLGLAVSCDDQECSSPPPREIVDWRNDDSARRREGSEDSAEAGECGRGAGAGHECGDQSAVERSAAL